MREVRMYGHIFMKGRRSIFSRETVMRLLATTGWLPLRLLYIETR